MTSACRLMLSLSLVSGAACGLGSGEADAIDGGYAVVVSEATQTDPSWAEVVAAVTANHRDRHPLTITWRESPQECLPELAKARPAFACFVARPGEASRAFVGEVHRLARGLDDDPYGDLLWGILTGFDAANALAIAKTSEPLVVRRVTSGTELAMDRVAEGVWYCELEQNRMVRKQAGGEGGKRFHERTEVAAGDGKLKLIPPEWSGWIPAGGGRGFARGRPNVPTLHLGAPRELFPLRVPSRGKEMGHGCPAPRRTRLCGGAGRACRPQGGSSGAGGGGGAEP